MSGRRLDALRRLAERPGSANEGEIARRMLERELRKQVSSMEAAFLKYLRREVDATFFVKSIRFIGCGCGAQDRWDMRGERGTICRYCGLEIS